MYAVVIVFKNGSKVQFYVNQFDFDPDQMHLHGNLYRIDYLDRNGDQSFIFITPNEVSSIVVAPNAPNGDLNIRWG